METIGFILILLGAASMDSQGNTWYIAAGMIILGCFLMHVKNIIKNYKRNHYTEKEVF